MQCIGRLGLLTRSPVSAPANDGHLLDFAGGGRRNDAGGRRISRDQLESDLGLATRHHRGHWLAGGGPRIFSALASDLIARRRVSGIPSSTQLRCRCCCPNRRSSSPQSSVSEGVDLRIRPGFDDRAALHHHADHDERASLHLAVGAHAILACELVGGAVIQAHDIRAARRVPTSRGSIPRSRQGRPRRVVHQMVAASRVRTCKP